jgi:hypothetical protein
VEARSGVHRTANRVGLHRLLAHHSPDDNKLRLRASARLDSELYGELRAAGFIWAPRQQLFVAPVWTPACEDLLLGLCDEIGDEDISLIDRAEERAERFEDYGERRAGDAEAARVAAARIADGIPLGQPILVGVNGGTKPRNSGEMEIAGSIAVVARLSGCGRRRNIGSSAAGALRHAKSKERPDVWARRIRGLEAERRKQERAVAEAQDFSALWAKPGLTHARARLIASRDHVSRAFPLAEFPRQPPTSHYEGSMSLCSALDGIISADQARDAALAAHAGTMAWCRHWIVHYDNRLGYERAMLGGAGGTVADRVGPQKGGGVRCWASPRGGWSFVQKVNRVSVTVLDNFGNGGPNFTRTIAFDELSAVLQPGEGDGHSHALGVDAMPSHRQTYDRVMGFDPINF